MSAFFVYIIKSEKDGSYYKGFTCIDPKTRLAKHNNGEVKSTCNKRPYHLVWYCVFMDKTKALAFERYIKQGSGFAFTVKHLI